MVVHATMALACSEVGQDGAGHGVGEGGMGGKPTAVLRGEAEALERHGRRAGRPRDRKRIVHVLQRFQGHTGASGEPGAIGLRLIRGLGRNLGCGHHPGQSLAHCPGASFGSRVFAPAVGVRPGLHERGENVQPSLVAGHQERGVLRRPRLELHARGAVRVGPCLQQQLDDLQVPAAAGELERRLRVLHAEEPAADAVGVGLGAGVQERAHNGEAAAGDRAQQRRRAMVLAKL
mmetsp:Transcript_97837/g.281483  ORF Transcript_97837/g.281483 Transcript_97837/m.281483 type:complete len:233 (+) Transcript_97837:133-831(+)